MSFEDQLLIVRRNDFLAHLRDEEYEALDIIHNIIVAERGAYIYFDAHQLNRLYFVKEGFIRIGNVDDDGNELVRDILQPGDVFGQITLLPDNLHGEFAQAHKCKVSLCSFSIDSFSDLLQSRPELAVVFARKIGQRLRRIENRLLNLLQKDVRTRLLYFFWTLLSISDGERQNEPFILPNYFTHKDIARLTGTSRQTVTTLINQFAQEGLLNIDRQNITILDIKLLEKGAKVG